MDPRDAASIAQTLEPGSTLLRIVPLEGGLSATMTVLEIATTNGKTRRIVARQPGADATARNPHAARDEFKLLEHLRRAGLAVPPPVYLDVSKSVLPTPYCVTEFVEGAAQFLPRDLNAHLRQAAHQLAAIHAIDANTPALAFLPRFETVVSDRLASEPARRDEALYETRIRAALATHWPRIHRDGNALLHGDYWPGNIIWQDGRLAAVIDWEHAARGNPLADLAISRLDNYWGFGHQAMIAYTAHYASSTDIDLTELPVWDVFAALRPMGNLKVWAQGWSDYGRPDVTEELMRNRHGNFLRQALLALGIDASGIGDQAQA